MSRLQTIVRWANRLAQQVDGARVLPIAALSLLYLAVTAVLAQRKLMWNDELYTYYMARLPSMSDVWAALMSRGEQTPPFFYFTTRVSFDLFGVNNLSVRLPEMLGFWMMLACLYVFVARRASTLAGLCAAAFPLVTIAYLFAFEARPYGLLLGCGALALVSWQSVTLNRHRAVSLICLAASVAAMVSTQYYGVLILLPLALANRAEPDAPSSGHRSLGGNGGVDRAARAPVAADQDGRGVLVRILVTAAVGQRSRLLHRPADAGYRAGRRSSSSWAAFTRGSRQRSADGTFGPPRACFPCTKSRRRAASSSSRSSA